MGLIDAAEQAYNELSRLHHAHGTKCPGIQLCPTARVMLDLMRAIADERGAIGEFKHAHQWRGEPESTYKPMEVEDVATALLTAQSGIGRRLEPKLCDKCGVEMPPLSSFSTCTICRQF